MRLPTPRRITQEVKARLMSKGDLQFFNGSSYYQGRPLIDPGTLIDGGVYVGPLQREAIVVDFEKSSDNPEHFPNLKSLYMRTKLKTSELYQFGAERREDLRKDIDLYLPAVFNTVNEAIPTRDESYLNSLVKACNFGNDTKVHIDFFIGNGIGIDRQLSLICGVLLERLIKEKFLQGRASIDREVIISSEKNIRIIGEYSRCNYTAENGKIFTLDVMGNYLGPLNGSP